MRHGHVKLLQDHVQIGVLFTRSIRLTVARRCGDVVYLLKSLRSCLPQFSITKFFYTYNDINDYMPTSCMLGFELIAGHHRDY